MLQFDLFQYFEQQFEVELWFAALVIRMAFVASLVLPDLESFQADLEPEVSQLIAELAEVKFDLPQLAVEECFAVAESTGVEAVTHFASFQRGFAVEEPILLWGLRLLAINNFYVR